MSLITFCARNVYMWNRQKSREYEIWMMANNGETYQFHPDLNLWIEPYGTNTRPPLYSNEELCQARHDFFIRERLAEMWPIAKFAILSLNNAFGHTVGQDIYVHLCGVLRSYILGIE